MPRRALCARAALAPALAMAACNLATGLEDLDGSRPDGARSDGAVDAPVEGSDWDASGGRDEETTRDVASDPGPMTLVLMDAEVDLERRCDFDGDGDPDNSVADLGEPNATLFAIAMGQFIERALNDDGARVVLHFPSVEDRTAPHDPEALVITGNASDADPELDRENDFDGDAPFFIDGRSLDACGEPLFYSNEAEIDRGIFRAEDAAMGFPFHFGYGEVRMMWLRGVSFEGTIEPGGRGADLVGCGYATIEQIGGLGGDVDGLTMLEIFVFGGATWGVEAVLGLTPDVDLDGDGLERFALDDEGRIVTCIDGDSTEIPGNDCWSDPRMADAFSVNTRLTLVSAVFAGRSPGWELMHTGESCESPPEVSLFEPQ